MTDSLMRTAMADQVAAMRAEADELEDEAWDGDAMDLEDRLALGLKAIDLRNAADRLEKRTEEHIDMLPSISKHNGMVTP